MTKSLAPRLAMAPVAAAALLSLLALYKMEGRSVALPALALLIAASAIVRYRLPDTPAALWIARIPMFSFIIVANLWRTVDSLNMFDVRTMTWVGEFAAGELAIACCTMGPAQRLTARPLWLSGLVMLAASSTPDDTFMIAIAPAYFCAVLIALRTSASAAASRPDIARGVPWRFGLALSCVMLGGGGVSALLTAQRSNISQWGMQLLGERLTFETGALSLSPILSSTFGQRGSMTRALRIEGEGDFSHLRGSSFTTYQGGQWGPRSALGQVEETLPSELEPTQPGVTARVTRLLNNHGLLFVPIDAAGIHLVDGATPLRTRQRGDMIRVIAKAPSLYVITLGSGGKPGPISIAPTEDERKRLLEIPRELDPRVRLIADGIFKGIPHPRRRLQAIEQYLMSHHRYSLKVDIGRGDPLSNFLLQDKPGHCEFFASAAVVLARMAGVPARYVVGYSGHERDDGNGTVVRQRDAHAWAECWFDGRGWEVLDATPGDGRPEALAETPSRLTKWMESIQDSFTAFRLGAHRGTVIRITAVILTLVVLAAAARAIFGLRRRGERRTVQVAYTASDIELTALFREFELECRRIGLACPPQQTWTEYLTAAELQAPGRASAEQRAAAIDFLARYNQMRFGLRRPDQSADQLRAKLHAIGRGASLGRKLERT